MRFNDSDALGYLISQLAYVEPQVWQRKYGNIIYQDLVPVSNQAGEWATSVEVHYMDGLTEGKFVGEAADDLPYAQITTGRDQIPVRYAGIGYDYSLEELRQSAFLNRPLDALKGMVARRGYEEHAQRVCFYGDSARGLSGFLNHPSVGTAGAGSTFAAALAGATPGDSVAAIINEPINAIIDGTKGVEIPDTVLLPIARYNTIASTRLGSQTDTTILKFVQENNATGRALRIMGIPQLSNSMVVYKSDPEVMVFHIPMPLRFLPPQPVGLKFRIPGEYKLSGVEMRYPGAVLYRTNI